MGNDTESHVGYEEEFLIVGIPGGGNALLNREKVSQYVRLDSRYQNL